ncbi:Dyp-type peroxidase [Pseudidiomarina taiwanensis]|uniref:Peroxidase n=1 Tax=Pseudidiomarina taiwanensis TaxID=337250 RepID=A0A432ZKQ7_9GAMM|nr:Dyp-type peroxidase [Pseudidiomarina taiwanensis]RUO78493.1 peroxidase [Pseudidiomarina taiwanensis]
MARAQSGIYAEPNLHGLTLLFNVMTDDVESIRRKLARIPTLLNELDDRFSEAMLNGYVAIGNDYWDVLYPQQRPLQLNAFPDLRDGDRQAPRSSVDLLVTVRSDRFDVTFHASRTILNWLGYDVELVEQIKTFRFLDGRDLTGFIEAPQNPRGLRRKQVALLSSEEDPQFSAGSYLFLQKFRHDLRRWEQLEVEMQEHVMGRNKRTGEKISEAVLSMVTHAQKARLLNDDEQPLRILQQNMPWGDLREQGLLGLYFSAQPADLISWLKRRYQEDHHGDYDPLLDYIEAVSNASFFVPSVDFLEAHA